jgi:hypothetical protein
MNENADSAQKMEHSISQDISALEMKKDNCKNAAPNELESRVPTLKSFFAQMQHVRAELLIWAKCTLCDDDVV